MSIWKPFKFSQFLHINPTVSLKGKEIYPFIEMKDLNDGQRVVHPSQERLLAGGARFAEYDTLFARITPCLENGKICQAKGLRNGVGFGSTEFLVFRERKGISDKNFIYYLSRWEEVRRYAELNLVGTSGRQRVPKDVFDKLELTLPDLKTQKRIAEILTDLDAKIQLNRRVNQTLEQMVETLYKQNFVKDLDNLPEGWKSSDYNDYISSISITHKFPKAKIIFLNTSDILNGEVLINNYSDVDSLPGQAKKSIKKEDILFSEIRPANRRFAYINFEADDYVVSTKLMVLRAKGDLSSLFFYFLLTREETLKYLQNIAESRSGTFPQITFDQVEVLKFNHPNDNSLHDFIKNILEPTYQKIFKNSEEIKTLEKIRDTLLPKFMSGEIDVMQTKAEELYEPVPS